jgi:hypothetical protein
MQWSDIPLNPSRRTLAQFAALLCGFSVAAAIVQGVKGHDAGALGLAAVALVSALVGGLRPGLLRPVFVGWMVLAFPVGWTVSRIMLALLFYAVFTPLGLVFRALRRDPLMLLQRSGGGSTYWSEKRVEDEPRAYFRQF